jgi:hypothetical protein
MRRHSRAAPHGDLDGSVNGESLDIVDPSDADVAASGTRNLRPSRFPLKLASL